LQTIRQYSSLLPGADGPWASIAERRALLAETARGHVGDCLYCMSLWVVLPVVIVLSDGWIALFVQWPALLSVASLSPRRMRWQEWLR